MHTRRFDPPMKAPTTVPFAIRGTTCSAAHRSSRDCHCGISRVPTPLPPRSHTPASGICASDGTPRALNANADSPPALVQVAAEAGTIG